MIGLGVEPPSPKIVVGLGNEVPGLPLSPLCPVPSPSPPLRPAGLGEGPLPLLTPPTIEPGGKVGVYVGTCPSNIDGGRSGNAVNVSEGEGDG